MREDYVDHDESIRNGTRQLFDLLREHHPEAMRGKDGESQPDPVPEPGKVPEPIAAPICTGEVILTPMTATMRLIREVAVKHGLTIDAIKGGRRRYRRHVAARHEVMARLRTEHGMSLHGIARALGGYDHSTVHHGLQAYAARAQREADRGA